MQPPVNITLTSPPNEQQSSHNGAQSNQGHHKHPSKKGGSNKVQFESVTHYILTNLKKNKKV